VGPLSAVVYRAAEPLERSRQAPAVTLADPGSLRDRAEIRADVGGDQFAEVTFLARVGNGGWRPSAPTTTRPTGSSTTSPTSDPGTGSSTRRGARQRRPQPLQRRPGPAPVAPPRSSCRRPPTAAASAAGRGAGGGHPGPPDLRVTFYRPGRTAGLDTDRHRQLLAGLHRLRRHHRARQRQHGSATGGAHLRPRPDGEQRRPQRHRGHRAGDDRGRSTTAAGR
jgi:hypothetical protein